MYSKIPCNFEDIKYLFDNDINNIGKCLVRKQTIIFYDTCSLNNHARVNAQGQYELLDLFSDKDVVVVTDKILQEMINEETDAISEQYIKYLELLKSKVNCLILLCECEFESLLSTKFDNRTHIRGMIAESVKTAFSQLPNCEQKSRIFTADIEDRDFLKTILTAADSITRKNRGEISLMISMLVIEKLRVGNYKVLTDDKKCINYMLQPFETAKARSNISLQSTPKMVQFLFKSHSVWATKSVDEIVSCLNTVRTDGNNALRFKKIIDGTVYHNIYQEQMTNVKLAENILNNSIEIVF